MSIGELEQTKRFVKLLQGVEEFIVDSDSVMSDFFIRFKRVYVRSKPQCVSSERSDSTLLRCNEKCTTMK